MTVLAALSRLGTTQYVRARWETPGSTSCAGSWVRFSSPCCRGQAPDWIMSRVRAIHMRRNRHSDGFRRVPRPPAHARWASTTLQSAHMARSRHASDRVRAVPEDAGLVRKTDSQVVHRRVGGLGRVRRHARHACVRQSKVHGGTRRSREKGIDYKAL